MSFFKKNEGYLLVLLFAFLSIILSMVAQLFFIPYYYQVNDDFRYDADILSLDNFFDAETNKFLGEKRSVTSFGYLAEKSTENEARLKNFFDVRTVTGDQIIKIQKHYQIHSKKWTHINDDQHYLFAPRALKKGGSFKYSHVNYSKPIEMVYEAEEYIEGLKTYVYSTSFGDDQTSNLDHLPGVPEEKGVNLDISLKLWIEPISGWLVKYEDNAIAYYYNIETGKRTHPWNKFKNQYRKNSVIKQVKIAHSQKMGILLIQYFLPGFIFILLTCSLILIRRKNKMIILVFMISTLLLGGLYWTLYSGLFQPKIEPIKIGISKWVNSTNPAYDENIKGFKESIEIAGYKSKEIVYLEESANTNADDQKLIIQKFLEENVDLIYSLTTPGTLLIKDSVPSLPIVFSVVTYPVEAGLIESVKRSGNNLVGTRNWVPIIEQLKIFLEIAPQTKSIGFLRRKNEPNSMIQLDEMKKAAESLNIKVVDISGANLEELKQNLGPHNNIDSLYSACDTLIQGESEEMIIEFAYRHKIPSFSCNSSGPLNGDLIGTVADFYQIGQLAGKKAALILGGATPTSLETQTAIRSFIYVNQKTAEHLGIRIPQNILAQAKKIIR